MKIASIATLLVALHCSLPATAAEIVVVVHADSTVDAIAADDVKELFLGKRKKLPDGSKAVLVKFEPLASAFNRTALGKSDSQVRSTWSRLVFSGKARPPKAFDSAIDVIEYVAANPSAVAYLDASALTAAVKAVHTVD